MLGTFVKIISAVDTSAACVDAAFAEIELVDKLMSPKATGIDITKIKDARSGEVVELHDYTAEVIRVAESIIASSGGAFDIFVGPADSPRVQIAWISAKQIRVDVPGLVDLGGIAKGFAVDRALKILREGGAAWALVDAGGDAAAFGRPQRYSIRHPLLDGQSIGALEFSDCALATSSPQFTREVSRERVQHHLFDPAERVFGPVDRSATVLAKSCMIADALTKVVYFRGDSARPVLEKWDATGWSWTTAAGWQQHG